MTILLNQSMMGAMAKSRRQRFPLKSAGVLYEYFAAHYCTLKVTESALIPLVQSVQDYAALLGIDSERDIMQLCCVAASIGFKFWYDPRFEKMVSETIENDDIQLAYRTGYMSDEVSTWLEGFWRNYSFAELADAQYDHVVSEQAPDRVAMQAIFPNHWQILDAKDNAKFLRYLLQTPPSFSSTAQLSAYVIAAYAFGAHWWQDPQYHSLSALIKTARTTEDLARRSVIFYKALHA